jgi:hypothetical protein
MPAGPSGGIANVAAAGRRTTLICPGQTGPVTTTRRPGAVAGLIRRRDDVDPGRAESRVSAYVYGNVLVLAAVVGASPATVASGAAVAVVAGTVLSTYVAHVLAHSIGSLFGGANGRSAVRVQLRDAVPVLSSGVTPALLLVGTALGWLSVPWGQGLASFVVVARIAATGVVYRRLREDVPLRKAWTVGALAAGVAAVAVVLKLTLTH